MITIDYETHAHTHASTHTDACMRHYFLQLESLRVNSASMISINDDAKLRELCGCGQPLRACTYVCASIGVHSCMYIHLYTKGFDGGSRMSEGEDRFGDASSRHPPYKKRNGFGER